MQRELGGGGAKGEDNLQTGAACYRSLARSLDSFAWPEPKKRAALLLEWNATSCERRSASYRDRTGEIGRYGVAGVRSEVRARKTKEPSDGITFVSGVSPSLRLAEVR